MYSTHYFKVQVHIYAGCIHNTGDGISLSKGETRVRPGVGDGGKVCIIVKHSCPFTLEVSITQTMESHYQRGDLSKTRGCIVRIILKYKCTFTLAVSITQTMESHYQNCETRVGPGVGGIVCVFVMYKCTFTQEVSITQTMDPHYPR